MATKILWKVTCEEDGKESRSHEQSVTLDDISTYWLERTASLAGILFDEHVRALLSLPNLGEIGKKALDDGVPGDAPVWEELKKIATIRVAGKIGRTGLDNMSPSPLQHRRPVA